MSKDPKWLVVSIQDSGMHRASFDFNLVEHLGAQK